MTHYKRSTPMQRFARRTRKNFRYAAEHGLLANKFAAVALIALTLPISVLENDWTSTVFVSLLAVPMFFAKTRWIY